MDKLWGFIWSSKSLYDLDNLACIKQLWKQKVLTWKIIEIKRKGNKRTETETNEKTAKYMTIWNKKNPILILKDCSGEHSWNKQLFLLKRLHSHGWFPSDLINY